MALHSLARGGRALELGIGTGRIALPLQQQGTEVHGIDASDAMLAQLRAKPGSDTISLTTGNFADVAVEGDFALVYVVFNTFYGLLTQEEQIRCFQNVAQHLSPDGLFVIEAFVPDLTRYDRGQSLRTIHAGTDNVRIDAAQLDPVAQQITVQHIVLSEQGTRLYPVKLRYAWPTEFDLMARLAGLTLQERWSSWQRAPFTAASGSHISLYGHAA